MGNNKKITITTDTKVRDVQAQFETCYPFLKIEFSKSKSGDFTRSSKVNPDNLISKISSLPGTVSLNVEAERTIAQVEEECQKLLGLSIQICRKSGNISNAISITNSWTLQSQNIAAEFISAEMQKSS
ncbi:hypothetical protein [Segetibacter sp.]|jgi:hypothetical protein|uniref:hypothetical protein n=1 Tax=Segetibacter sp. TaxID=2231182 RepID=UPI00260988F7|nr:hypothetical protein [Segetibacter sp.]MCW3079042.1 hypothetical protein [Segetibacter sp.]